MSDPVGYVESHGGVTGFLARQLMPSSAPLPAAVRLTPAPFTPVPGLMSPVPGMLNTGMVGPTPTTLSSAAGAAGAAPTRSKTPFFIAAGLVVALTGIGVFMVLNKKSSTPAAQPDNGSDGSAETMVENGSNQGSAVVQTPPPVTPDAAVAVVTPDAAVQVVEHHETGSGAGSAAVVKPVTNVSLTVNTTPPGADIYVNSAPANKQTPSTLELPPGTYKITLRNKGFDDYRKTVSLKGDQKVDATLKKYVPPTNTGKGKGSGTKVCDTCLERPD
jgi:hypothetical protein